MPTQSHPRFRSKYNDALLALAMAVASGVSVNLPFVVARPIDGTTDDWPALMGPSGVVATATAEGKAVVMLPGTGGQPFVCKTGHLGMPSGALIIMSPEVVVNQTLSPTGGVTNAAFTGTATFGATLTLSANPVVGSNQIVVTSAAGVVKGTKLALTTAAGTTVQLMTVTNVSGTTITVDRPILVTMTTVDGSTVRIVTANPDSIQIVGNGATVQGTGEGFVHFLYGSNIEVSDLNLVATNSDPTQLPTSFTYDTGCFDCVVEGVRTSGGTLGVQVAGAEAVTVRLCYVEGPSSNGYPCIDSLRIVHEDDQAYACGANGLTYDGTGGNTFGTMLSKVVRGQYGNCTLAGISINGGSNRNQIIGAEMTGNTGIGGAIGSTGAPDQNTWFGAIFSSNPGGGLLVNAGTRNRFIGCQTFNNSDANPEVTVNANSVFIGLTSIKSTTGVGGVSVSCTTSGTQILMQGCTIENANQSGTAVLLEGNAATRLAFSGRITLDGSGTPIAFNLLTAAILSLSDFTLDGTGNVIGINGNTGTTTRIGENVDLTTKAPVFGFNITTPGAFINKTFPTGSVSGGPAPFTATGVTPVNIAWPALKKEDTVLLELTGGTVAAGTSQGTLTQTPGTGFSYVGNAVGDTGQYAWRIV